MTTYFDTLSTPFNQVSLDPGVNTAQFLDASKGLVKMFGHSDLLAGCRATDLLGSAAFSVVQKDLNGNIAKIQTRLDADPTNSATLEGMLAEEAKGSDKTATQALLWLLRGLEFTLVGLKRSLEDPNEELSVSFNNSYNTTLKAFHSFVVRPVFSLAMKACPYRNDFYQKLGSPPERVHEQGKQWLDGLEVIVTKMKALYAEKGYGTGL
ncbi:hypothetical protein M408DRAFT_6268 [Serendipita vermifera MAFF 305830]|uniref:Glycolipid transfer protein domain-containing protein n=1 Tax=Serendipita vermifera MAFF 305830 TaxID=933852 RepID=A0A0C2XVD3_SERVB|nr:hypothetical protein M408DRAFT_6268 [Serendipita vermifera MAFF 305830]